MKASQADIFIIPGLNNSGPDHWQSRWENKIKSARRIEQANWSEPQMESWVSQIIADVEQATRPAILVAHSLGVIAAVKAIPAIAPGTVKGAFLVGMPDVESNDCVPAHIMHFAPIPQDTLPMPSMLVASKSDPYCPYDRATFYAHKWGAKLIDAGDTGHINENSGQGPWPEGLMTFAGFLSKLS